MALKPAVGEIVQVTTICLCNRQNSINTFEYLVSAVAGGGLTDLQLAGYFAALLSGPYRGWMPGAASYEGTTCQIVAPVRKVLQFTPTGGGDGSAGDVVIPTQVTGVISKITDRAGRGYRGRVYPGFPGVTYQDDNGEMNGGGIIALSAIATAIPTVVIAAVGAVNTTLVQEITDRDFNVKSEVVRMFARGKWGTQRRRGDYGQRNT